MLHGLRTCWVCAMAGLRAGIFIDDRDMELPFGLTTNRALNRPAHFMPNHLT
jgi:hypothetical protein